MVKRLIFLLLAAVGLTSCVQVRGIGDDYKYLTIDEKSRVVPFKTGMTMQKGTVYKTNADELLKEIEKYPKAFVYLFTPLCSSDACLPLNIYESYAEDNDYKVFFVLSSYKDMGVALKEPISEPLFVIDSDYYGHKLFGKYVDYFENELMELDKKHKLADFYNLFFYENGTFVGGHTYLPPVSDKE